MQRTLGFGFVAAMAWLLVACGGGDGEASAPVTAPTVLRLVATPSIGSVDADTYVEAVVAYPERVTGTTWDACVLFIDDPTSAACPIPSLSLYAWNLFATRLDRWAIQSVGSSLGVPLFEALSQVKATHPEQLSSCVTGATATWDACVADGWPEQCAYGSGEQLRACVLQGGVDVRVQVTVRLDDDTTLVAGRRIRFEKSGSPAIGNRNPVLFNVQIGDRLLLPGDTIQVPVGTTLLLDPTPFEQSVETYTDAATGQTLAEQLTFSWIRTGGDLDADHTPFDDALNTLFIPESAAGLHLSLWVFLEDNRGGIDWERVGIDPVPTP